METTTDAEINQENATRCFELRMDESEQQTARIHKRQRENRLPVDYDRSALAETIRKQHHNAQRMLKPMAVFIPFADKIEFPTRWLRTRRDNERFLSLIEAIAFLHQHQRTQGETRDGKAFCLATLADYRLAYNLASEILSYTFHELSLDAQGLWAALVPYVRALAPDNPTGFVFSLKHLRAAAPSSSNHYLRSRMRELVDMEYVESLEAQNGKLQTWRLLSTEGHVKRRLAGLTTPDELAQRLA